MSNSEYKELEDAIERQRNTLHPELDAEFLIAVLRAEQDNAEDEPAAIKRIQQELDRLLGKEKR